MKKELKNAKGITLIALIITIIVLLILAVVSINLVTNDGIITKTQLAVNEYQIAQEKEQIMLAYAAYQMGDDFAVEGAEVKGTGPWTIEFNNTGNKYIFDGKTVEGPLTTDDLDILETYFLGEDKKGGIEFMTLLDQAASAESGKNVFNNKDIVDTGYVEQSENDPTVMNLYVKYNNALYAVGLDVSSDSLPTKNVSLVYKPSGREGQTITYSYDGTAEHEEQWTILYDNGDNIEIISPSAMGSLTLGASDEEAQGTTEIDKAIDSYNNAITRINGYCSGLVTNSNQISVRSVGSNPDNPSSENNTMYTSENWPASSYNGKGKSTDTNFRQDYLRMICLGVIESSDGNNYWFASRVVNESGSTVLYCVRYSNMDEGGLDSQRSLWRLTSTSSAQASTNTRAVRPIVKVNF